ncbi:hypothetical protein AB833_30700 [Chromatiales bacterium (ex Bugula neritina AB1)]|nr:hypothetical protein AB833_30700 [Chromatiales bacterium (ex Bugula neritina AB1)]
MNLLADSLRDQLIAAGYQAPKKDPPKKPGGKKPNNRSAKNAGNKAGASKDPKQRGGGNKQHAKRSQTPKAAPRNDSHRRQQQGQRKNSAQESSDLEAIEERKKLKARIKVLIDENKSDAWKGEVVYRYLVDKRIRELYVTEEFHKRLANRELAVTRLNGDTFLVPREIAVNIKEINPQWSVFNLESADENTATTETDQEYAEFQVPDDLKW